MQQMREHIKQTHLSERRVALGVTPSKAKEIEEAKAKEEEKNNPVMPQATPIAQPPEKPQRRPIVLEYKFTGQCQVCGLEVETVDVEVEGKLYMMAYCNSCKTKRAFVHVYPMGKMGESIKEDAAEEIAIEEHKGVWPINKFRKK